MAALSSRPKVYLACASTTSASATTSTRLERAKHCSDFMSENEPALNRTPYGYGWLGAFKDNWERDCIVESPACAGRRSPKPSVPSALRSDSRGRVTRHRSCRRASRPARPPPTCATALPMASPAETSGAMPAGRKQSCAQAWSALSRHT